MESRFDNPFSLHNGYYQPSIVWAAEYAVGTGVLAYGVNRVTHLSPLKSSIIAAIGIGLIPHIAGYGRGEYNISLDWAYDLWTRSLPIMIVLGESPLKNKNLSRLASGLIYTGGTLILHCFASP